MDVFLDTVGLIAVWDERDQWHAQANQVYANLLAGGRRLVVTPPVLYECGNMAARRKYRGVVDDLRRVLDKTGAILVPTPEDETAAWDAYVRGEAGDAGIVDQVSFAVMRRLGLTEAFTNDRHFQAAGFTTLF